MLNTGYKPEIILKNLHAILNNDDYMIRADKEDGVY